MRIFVVRNRLASRWLWVLVVGALLLVVPLRIIQHVDVYWRLPLWTHCDDRVRSHPRVVGPVFRVARESGHSAGQPCSRSLQCQSPTSWKRSSFSSSPSRWVNLVGGFLPLFGYPVDVSGNSLVVKGELFDVAEGCSGNPVFSEQPHGGHLPGRGSRPFGFTENRAGDRSLLSRHPLQWRPHFRPGPALLMSRGGKHPMRRTMRWGSGPGGNVRGNLAGRLGAPRDRLAKAEGETHNQDCCP